MTNTPGTQFTQLVHHDQLASASNEAIAATGMVVNSTSIDVGRRSYSVVSFLTPNDMAAISDAQESGDLAATIASFGRLVPKKDRDNFVAYVLDDPDDDADRVSFPELTKRVNELVEHLMGRPTDR